MPQLASINEIENRILLIRSHKVMIDVDIASIYGVTAKRLREQVRRNLVRFPSDFMFQLTREEKLEVAAKCGNLSHLKFSPALPYAFTEHGAVMLASVLNSGIAVRASIQIVRVFTRLKELVMTHKDLTQKLIEIEKKYDVQFKVVFDAIRELMTPPVLPRKKIGFL